MSFFTELKRRNVIKVAAAYVIVGWLILQVGEVLAPALRLPDWVNSTLAFFILLGFPLAIIFAWAFEMTSEGLKLEKDVDRSKSITHQTGQKLNYTIIALLVLAVVYFAFDKFVLDPGRDAAEIEAAVQTAQIQPASDSAPVLDRSIAVLPFVNMSSDEEQEYFSDGLSEELLNLLAKIPELQVAARTSSFSFKGQHLEIPDIAARLGVAHVLEGSVRKAGDQVRITAQLIKADDGFHLWSETYDRTLDNIFQIQDEIADHVVESLKITLLGEAPRVRETDPEAYRLFLEAQFHSYQRTPESHEKAIALFRQALAIDPEYVPAWSELGFTLFWMLVTGGGSDQTEAQSREAVLRALELDSGYGKGYFVRALMATYVDFDFESALRDAQLAIQLDPGSAMAHQSLGTAQRAMGRFDSALKSYERSVRLDPLVPEILGQISIALWYMGRNEDAREAYEKVLSLSPGFVGGAYRLGRMLVAQSDLDAAQAVIQNERSDSYRIAAEALLFHSQGKAEEARTALKRLTEEFAERSGFQIAEIHAFRGEHDLAFEWLNRSLDQRDSGLAQLLGFPTFKPLLDDPRWEAFLARMNLVEAWRAMPPEWGGPQG